MTKLRTDILRSIDIRTLKKQGLLIPANFRRRFARDGYSHYQNELLSVELGGNHYIITVVRTATEFRGRRERFRCPKCDERRAILYLWESDLTCRTCNGFAYPSQLERKPERAPRKARNIRKKLGWSTNFMDAPGSKPKGMHWRTFDRLVTEHDHYHAQFISAWASRLGLPNS